MLKRKKVKPITLRDVAIIDDGKLRKTITTALLGNAMEWFDSDVYGFAAYALGKMFFPGADPSMQMVAALATFSVPFLIRPPSGLFFGMLGNKCGRQRIFAITIMIMSISTLCISLTPSYASIGIWASILLLLCKMAQGFSVGGGYTGVSIFVAEYSPDRRRRFMGSWLDFGSIVRFVLGASVVVLISTIVDEDNFLEWGQYIPFFLALPLDLIGLYLRRALEGMPAFQQHMDKLEQGDYQDLREGSKASFKGIITKHQRNLLAYIGLMIITSVAYYILFTYMPSYLSHNLHYSEDYGVLVIIAIMVGVLFVQPIMGLLNDRLGRRPFTIMGSTALSALAIPALILVNSNVIGLIFVGLLILTVILNCFTGVVASTLPVMFPTHVRYSTPVAALNISVLIADLTPTLVAWLVGSSQSLMIPAHYLMVIVVVGLITGMTMEKTVNQPLRGTILATSDIQEAKGILSKYYGDIEQKIEDIDQEIAELQVRCTRLVQQHPHIEE